MHRRLISFALCLVLALSACGAQSEATSTESTVSATAQTVLASPTGAALNGSAWVLVSIDGEAPPPEPAIRLEFEGGYARGFAGCNFFDGSFQAEGPLLRLREIAQTAMLCPQDALMRQEDAFFAALRSTEGYVLQGERLELRDDTGVSRLVFRPLEQQALDPSALRDTRWQLESFASAAPVGERPLTLELGASGEASGDAGCRTYTATWQAEADRIDFPMISMDTETCDDTVLLTQEGAFTDALSTAHRYRLVDGQLELLSDRNGPLRFARLP